MTEERLGGVVGLSVLPPFRLSVLSRCPKQQVEPQVPIRLQALREIQPSEPLQDRQAAANADQRIDTRERRVADVRKDYRLDDAAPFPAEVESL